MVGHINGHEEDISPENLIWICRSCNARSAYWMHQAGVGRRVKQFNPSGHGAQTLAQWMAAVMSMKGESDQMPISGAVEMIHQTPPGDRSRFAREVWRLRRQHGTAGSGSKEYANKIPF
jgi:hypothetical protein